MPSPFLEYFYQFPPVSRTLLVIITLLYCVASLNIISPYKLIWVRSLIIPQVWRLITPFITVLGKPINFAWDVFTLHRISTTVESFFPTPATYATFLLLTAAVVNLLNIYTQSFLLFPSLLGGLAYYYSIHLPADSKVGILFFQIPVRFYPYALMAMDFLMTQDVEGVKAMGMGLLGAHFYVYLDEVLPACGGRRLISTPQWLEKLFGSGPATGGVHVASTGGGRTTSGAGGSGASAGSSTGSNFFGGSSNWGKRSGGRRLGD